MDFETLYNERVEKCSHETAFNKAESKALYNLCYSLPRKYYPIIEIGVEHGRSTAVIGTVAAERGISFRAVDPVRTETIDKYHLGEWNLDFIFRECTSQVAANEEYPASEYLSLVHIDGDHSYDSVLFDCHAWLPRVVRGGYACFDDYDHPGLDDVKKAVDQYMWKREDLWRPMGVYGNKLAVYRKISYA